MVGGEPVSAANVVVIEAQRVGTGMFDSAGGPVPEFVFVGQGPVTVFTKARESKGRGPSRRSSASPLSQTSTAG